MLMRRKVDSCSSDMVGKGLSAIVSGAVESRSETITLHDVFQRNDGLSAAFPQYVSKRILQLPQSALQEGAHLCDGLLVGAHVRSSELGERLAGTSEGGDVVL